MKRGFTPLVVLLVLALTTSAALGGSLLLSQTQLGNTKNTAGLNKVLKTSSGYLDSHMLQDAKISPDIVGVVRLVDGNFSSYQLIDGALKENDFISETRIRTQSGEYAAISAGSSKITNFSLSNDSITAANIYTPAALEIELATGESLPLILTQATIVGGKVEGVVLAHTLTTGYTIALEVDRNQHITAASLQLGAPKANDATIALVKASLKKHHVLALIDDSRILGTTDERVLAGFTDSSIQPDELVPLFDTATGSWSFGTTDLANISTSPIANAITQLHQLNVTQTGTSSPTTVNNITNVISGLLGVKSTSSLLTVTTASNSATLSVNLQNSINSDSVIDGQIKESDLADDNISTNKIKDSAITNAKIESVDGSKIQLSTTGGLENNTGLSLLTTCAQDEILIWDGSTWACGIQTGGGGGGSTTVQEGDTTITASASVIDFSGSDFTLTNSPSGEANVSIDYTTSGIVRSGDSPASGDISGSFTSGFTIGSDTVTLGTDTTGNYVATVAGNSQIAVSGSGSENAGITLSVVADSIGDSQLAFNTGQNLTPGSSPSFTSQVLSAATNQLVLGTTNTTTISSTAPSASRVYTLPDFGGNDSFVGLAATQTFTNKTISGASNTLSNISNAALTNSAVTINSSGILTGGGSVSLGGNITLTATEADTLASVTARGSTASAITVTTLTINSDAFTDLTGTGLVISGGALQAVLGTSISNAEIDANAVTLGTQTTGNYVATITANGGLAMTGTEGASLGLITTCNDNEILKYTTAGGWACSTDSSGSGSSNSFETITVSNGTSPVADSATDTLTLTDGSGITITGTAGTDTISIAALLGTSIDSSEIVNDSILNADINSAAAIAFSKLATLTSGNILVGSSGNVATSVAMSGDVTIDDTGATTIGANKVTLATDTTGNYVATVTGNSQISVAGSGSEDAGVTLSIAADSIGDSQLTFNTGQNLTTASSPSFAANTLSNTTNQLVLGTTNTTTITSIAPAASRTATIPALSANDSFAFLDQAQTFTNKTISGASNTISNIGNAALTNSSITINTAGSLTGGGAVSLGGNITLTATEADTLASVTGRGASTSTALTLSSTSNTISAGTVTVSGDAITDFTGAGITISGGALQTTLGTSISNGEIDANAVTLGTQTTGNFVASATATGGLELTGTEAGSLGLITTCNDNELLKYTTAGGWACATDSSGSGSSNSFETIAVSNGTSPVADSATDTLTLTDGSGITLTGTAGTDTISIAALLGTSISNAEIDANAVTLATQTTGNYVATVTGNSQISVSGSGSENAGVTLSVAADSISDTQLAFNTGQHLTTSSSPAFASNTLSNTTNQLVLGTTDTVTINSTAPAASRVYTLPDFGSDDTFVGRTATQTLTNKTISGASNTITNIGNAALTNSSVTINSAGILSGGGAVSLGGNITLTATEADTLASVTGRGATTSTPLTLSSTSNALTAGTVTVSGDAITDFTGTGITISGGALQTTLGVAIDSSEITDNTITASDLSATLTFADGDLVDLSAINNSSATEGLLLPQATACTAATANGQICWDNDSFTLSIGNGSSAATISNPFGSSIDSSEITDDTIVNTDINSAAAIAFSKLAALTSGNILLGNGSNVATSVTMSGDVTIDNAGATTIGTNKVALATDTTGNYVATVTGNSQISVSGSGSEDAGVSLSIASDSIGDSQLAFNTGQNLTTSSSPTFGANTLANTTNQLVLGVTNTTTISSTAPSASRVYTLPDFGSDDTFVGRTATQTLTNKTISGASNTLSNIGNSSLTNSSVTINSAGILTGGGAISLGGNITLTATEADTLATVTGRGASTSTALTLSSTSNAITAGTVTVSGDAITDFTGTGITISGGALQTTLGVAIDSSEITDNTLTTSDLSATLAFADGDLVDLSAINNSSTTEGLLLPQATACTNATANGQICWDNDSFSLTIGNGTNAVSISNPFGASIDSSEITNDTIVDADVNSAAAIAFSKLAALTSGNILVGSAGNVATSVAVTGDVTIDNTGVTTIGANRVALTTDTTGNYVATATADGGLELTGTEGASLGLITTCADDQLLKYTAAGGWACADDSDTSNASNSFTTFAVSAGTNPVADSTTDTLTLTDGSGITLTGDATSDTITIAAVLGTSISNGEIDANAVTLATQTTGNYVASIAGGSQISVSGSGSENASVTISIAADSIGDSQLAFNTGQHLTTASTPTFAAGTLSNTTNQLVLGTTNTTTISSIAPSASRTATIPALTGNDSFAFLDQTQTLTNKTISGASNTLSNIGNSSLTNSSVTINSAGILTGGGAVSLGGNITLTATEADTLATVTGRGATTATALTLSSTSNVITAGTITVSGDAITDFTGTGITISGGALQTTLGTAIDSSEITDNTITATDISATLTLADGDLIDMSAVNNSSTTEGFLLPQATACSSATANGQICWDNDSFTLSVGNGSTITTVSNPFGASVDSSEITDDTIVNADINSAAAIAFSKLAALTSGNILVGSSSNVATSVALSGDVTISDTGVTTIGANTVTLATDTTGNYVADVTGSSQITVTGTGSENATAALSITANSIADAQLAFNTGQHLTTTSTPTFATNTLTNTTNQVILGVTNTTTISSTAPSTSRIYTIPDFGSDDTFVGRTATQTLTGKTISGASNTLSNIGNASLTNSSITINSAGILTGGAAVSLGGNITLTATEADTLATVTGRGATTATALTLSSTSNAISAGTVTVSGDAITDFTGTGITISGGALQTTLGTAIDSSEITDNTITTSDLAASLAFADGDLLDLSAINNSSTTEGLLLPQATACTNATANGQICWDNDSFTLTIGNGSTLTTISNPFGASIDSSEITNDTILDTDINSAAAIAFSKLAALTDGNILVGSSGNVASSVAMSGDVTIDNAGVTTIGANKVALTTDTTGNYVASATANGGLTMTGTEGGSLGILLPTAADAISSTTSSGSGLELTSSGLSLLQGCATNEVLKWNEAADVWACAADNSGSSSFTAAGDSGGGQTISDTNTLSILGGTNGIDTIDSATDTITLNLDTTEIGTTTFGSNSNFTWTLNGAGGTDPQVVVTGGSLTLNTQGGGTTISGASGDMVMDGISMYSNGSTFDLLGVNSTTVNFAAAATTLNIADAATTKTIDIGGVTSSGTDTVNIATNGTAADVITIGNSNASTTVAITGGTGWAIGTTGNMTGIGSIATDGPITLSPSTTTGSLITTAYAGSTTLTGDVTGIRMNLNTNVTGAADGSDLYTFYGSTPTVNNSSAATSYYNGLIFDGAALTNSGSGGVVWNGVEVTNPNQTQTSGTSIARGFTATTGTNTTGGTQVGFNVNAQGVSVGTLTGINISSITGGTGTETAISVGSGWDQILNLNGTTLSLTELAALDGLSGTIFTSGNYAATLDSVYVNANESPTSADITGSFSSGLTIGANTVALTTDTTGNYVASATANGGLALTGTEGASLGLITTCNDNELLKYTAAGGWACATDTGGSSSNSFETISVSNGTSPVADSATDTLTLADGTGITITGNSGTDTVSIAATLGTAIDTTEVTNDTLTLADVANSLTFDANLTFVSDSSTNDYKLILDNSSTGDVANLFQITTSGTGATVATAIDLSDADIATALALGANDVTVGGATISSTEFALLDSGITLSELTDTGTLTATTVDINGGAIDGVIIGASSAAAGTFTTVTGTTFTFELAGAAATQIKLGELTRTTSSTAADGIGEYISYNIEGDQGTNIEAGREGFILRDANNATNYGGEFVVSTWRDSAGQEGLWEVLSAYVDGGNKWICGNSARENGPDCFGFQIGSANITNFAFDGTNRYNVDYSTGVVQLYTVQTADAMKMKTLGDQLISMDQNNDGNDLTIDTDGQVGIGTDTPANELDVLSTTSPQFRISYDGSNYFTMGVSSTGVLTIDGTGTGTGIVLGDFTNGGVGCSALETSTTGAIVCGTDDAGGGAVKAITLHPEYAGATLTANGSASINGTITSDMDSGGTLNWRNYYSWTSSQTSLQDYTVAVRVTLPSDFSTWTSSNAVIVNYVTQLTATASNKVDISIYNETDSSGNAVASSLTQASGVAATWTTAVFDDSVLDNGSDPEWDATHKTAIILLKVYSKDSNYVRLGDIVLNYNAL